MNIFEFAKTFRGIPVFSIQDIEKHFPNFERDNLLNWQKKGVLLRIRNGWYSLTGEIKTLEHAYFTANKIYFPSYLSLESALAYYGWIPEGVFTFTSVTTLKTNVFDTPKGRFRYSTVKPALFFGYKILYMDGRGIKMAEPEKALLDFLYFHPEVQTEVDFDAHRFNLVQMHADLDMIKLANYNALFDMPALSKRLSTFKHFLNHVESF